MLRCLFGALRWLADDLDVVIGLLSNGRSTFVNDRRQALRFSSIETFIEADSLGYGLILIVLRFLYR